MAIFPFIATLTIIINTKTFWTYLLIKFGYLRQLTEDRFALGVGYLMGENLKVVWAKFSTLS
jgi:hypothetical protein